MIKIEALPLTSRIQEKMKHIFIINAGQDFEHAGGLYNQRITEETVAYFKQFADVEVQVTQVDADYNPEAEVQKYVWADYVIYHTPIWWFQVPFKFKKYIDEVFSAGHQNGLYFSDGRRSANPDLNYGKGGMLQGRKYMVTSSWNAPQTAFTLPGEFFNETPVDDGILFGFHRMNAFIGLDTIAGFHFHDVEKKPQIAIDMAAYKEHLEAAFNHLLRPIQD